MLDKVILTFYKASHIALYLIFSEIKISKSSEKDKGTIQKMLSKKANKSSCLKWQQKGLVVYIKLIDFLYFKLISIGQF